MHCRSTGDTSSFNSYHFCDNYLLSIINHLQKIKWESEEKNYSRPKTKADFHIQVLLMAAGTRLMQFLRKNLVVLSFSLTEDLKA